MNDWISVDDRLPKHNKEIYSHGVEVLVWPRNEGGTAFYGRRINAQPNFYKYGAVIDGITHWQPLPEPPK